MRIFDLKKQDSDQIFAFEIDNTFLTRRASCKIVRSIPQAKILKEPPFISRHEVFCEFELDAEIFEISETFTDNSCYWIGPKSKQSCKQLEIVRKAFACHKIFGFL